MTDEAIGAVEASEPVSMPEPAAEPASEPTSEPTQEAPKTPSRMEALEKAFKATESDPAETPQAKPEGDTSAEGDRPRGPDGKFVAKDTADQPEAKVDAKQTEEKPQEIKSEKAPISEAPARFSSDAKAAWKDAPESVRGEIQRAISEMETGLQQKDSMLEPLKPYLKMAEDSGTTVHEALSRYVNMEQALRQDLPRGLHMLAQNMGMTLGDMIQQVTGQPQDQMQQAKDQQILSLQNELNTLKDQIGQVTTNYNNDRQSSVEQEVAKFAADPAHARFDELADEIAAQLSQGHDLETAYRRAEMLNPLPQVETPAQPAPTPQAQTREAKSVTGSPAAGSNPANRKPSQTRTEALQRAFAQTGLA